MESIEQPIFNTYSDITDDKEELIDETTPKHGSKLTASESNNVHAEQSPLHAAKSLLSSGKQAMADQSKGLWIIIICTIVFALIITVALILTIYLVPKQIGGHAAVATEVGECSEIGLQIMKEGGNAVDAAVAAAFCLSVVHAQSSGIGGGGFLLYHDHKNEDSQAYDFRETAPAGSREALLTGDPGAVAVRGAAVGVPGELKGLAKVHSEYGRMDWSDLLEPAIDLALNGFNVTADLARALANHVDVQTLPGGAENGLLKYYYTRNKGFVVAGDIVTRPDLAATLQIIADEGADAFYRGNLGKRFVDMVTENGGQITMDDLKKYQVLKKDPIVSGFKGYKVLGMPAPSAGPVIALIMNMIEGFNWTEKSASHTRTYQQMIETFKFGFAHRGLLGDPADPTFTEAINNATEQFLSDEFAASLREKVDNSTHPPEYYGSDLSHAPNKGTTHLSVVDTSEVMINSMKPGKRPLSSMAPTIVYDADKPCAKRVILGASNNTRIITGIVETLVNAFVFNMNITQAISRPRLHQQLYPSDQTDYEDVVSHNAPGGEVRFPEDILQGLADMGQKMVPATEGLCTVQGIMKINDNIEAYSDWRKYGRAALF
ncbi:hypothetical protein BaRGS_00019363 [Batillaria attramentaria]|uniref:Gamma-glutamyltransferase n=1 Tax=Batillaria attramentaria TaxID=370345 RepID=A0ABD0KQI7_9CAEN